MTYVWADTETVGTAGPCKLVQVAVGDGPIEFIKLPSYWLTEFREGSKARLQLRQLFRLLDREDVTIVLWNATFDLYHLYHVKKELSGCTKPFRCQVLDLYCHAQLTGPFAAFAFSGRSKSGGKKVAAVRKVPLVAAPYVEQTVTERLQALVPGKVTAHRHEVPDRKALVTLSWTTDVSLSLKSHAAHWGEEVLKLKDNWPLVNRDAEKPHIGGYRDKAGDLLVQYRDINAACDAVLADDKSDFYRYAYDDIRFLRLAFEHLRRPATNANDRAVHVIAYTRFVGAPLDKGVLANTARYYRSELNRIETLLAGCNLKSHVERRALLRKYDPIIVSTKKKVLEAIANKEDHPAQAIASAMVRFGAVKQRLDQANKALETLDGRLHVDMRAVGTATNRQAGGFSKSDTDSQSAKGGFNGQGIAKEIEIDCDGNRVGLREAVLTAAVGDFSQFEVGIAASAWSDKQLLADLDEGIDVHMKTAVNVHPALKAIGITFDEAMKAKKDLAHPHHKLVNACRNKCKNKLVFPVLFGAQEKTIGEGMGVDEETAKKILSDFYNLYKGLAEYKRGVERRFCTCDTEGWSKGSSALMDDREVDLTGFTRYWTFEKKVAMVMWELGNTGLRMPVSGNIVRQVTKGPQSIAQAVRSAFLGAAISVQQAVFRQAANMRIQATGSNLCKMLQARLWDKFKTPMICVHDELVFISHPNFDYEAIKAEVAVFVGEYKRLVKHLEFDLKQTERWSDK